ncbi:hypothetical protein [Clostridium sp. JS66]|uniref:hypothetical protein n=1 Tax=Clostridium sp. JS66 TaxID=3064705 RepID=UPI00298E4FC4|nr:hypothetical protein [Clostridium sp. JS66]WPC42777.1 hypothetical protein Q6H37_04720 [Clostridium sp. JS66]
MKKFLSLAVIITTTLQFIVLHLFFSSKFLSFPSILPDILWMFSALSGTLFGAIFFKIYKGVDKTAKPVTSIVLFFLIGALCIIFNWGPIVVLLILLIFNIYTNIYRDSQPTLNLIISSVLSTYSVIIGSILILLYLLSLGISRM